MSSGMELADIHCHLIPYVDDGAYDVDECLALLKLEAEQGVRTICLTPHLRADMFETGDEEILSRFAMVQQLVREAELPLKLYLSREYHYDRIFRARLKNGGLWPMGEGKTLLLEFAWHNREEELLEAVTIVRKKGFTPLIAHVERYQPLQRDWAFAHELREAGARLQINAGSVLGREGLRQKHLCRQLLVKDLADVIASDAHDTEIRLPELALCAQHLEKKYGPGKAQQLLQTNPLALMKG